MRDSPALQSVVHSIIQLEIFFISHWFFFLFFVTGAPGNCLQHTSSGKNSDLPQSNSVDDALSRNGLNYDGTIQKSGPYFDLAASKNVTALLGKTTYLNCRVKNLGNKTSVSLIHSLFWPSEGAAGPKRVC